DGGQSAESAESSSAAAALAGYRIGDTGPGGGIVFYDAGSPQPWGRYLEAALTEERGGSRDKQAYWCRFYRDVGTSTGIGAGAANTRAMLAACSSGAATTVSGYRGGGMADWFLPSKDELNALFEQKDYVRGFVAGRYWSSSQRGAGVVWIQAFPYGDQISYDYKPDSDFYVRPVRAF
ncbi:MAG: hypothetical protein NTX29_10445, partial [Actinobacteria bacterium]|nr:hypothetical protein [Actinomycetota bacterium]